MTTPRGAAALPPAGPSIGDTTVGRAIAEAAAERRVGAPVYLRYAVEIAPSEDLLEAAAAAADFAIRVLGPAVDVYAAALADDQPEHLALTVRHRDGSVALLGIGRRRPDAPPVPSSVLLVGDRGVVEGSPAPTLPGAPDERPPGGAAGLPARGQIVEAISEAVRRGGPVPVGGDD